ncbi:hypothetical protein [Caproiciproducens sp. MSJ-32]|uniref:hypothetical protein n=1 Tax=Caproiciproducens sp. MSJ-32 TaxID=2841527 RepID=UPI001C11938C|nr:hypothetical protein [Caproiciproducens sp. MSJ-32]MBU5454209.1 hypothetical protein [Caproiciproducens sp. MSJ-32]
MENTIKILKIALFFCIGVISVVIFIKSNNKKFKISNDKKTLEEGKEYIKNNRIIGIITAASSFAISISVYYNWGLIELIGYGGMLLVYILTFKLKC